MKLSQLAIPTVTTMQLRSQDGNELLGIFITGHTPDSKEWRQAQRKFFDSGKPRSVQLGKKGTSMEIDNDPKAYEKRIQALASIVTNIEGIDDWTYSPEAVVELFSNDGCAWIVEQWEDHLQERENFLEPAAKPVKSGSKA